MRKRRNQSGSRIERTPIAVGSPFLPAAFSGFRIAHISDLHNTQFGEKNRRLLELLAEMKPDMIAVTGDLLDSRRTEPEIAVQFVSNAVKLAPVYYVPGNHESRIAVYEETEAALAQAGAAVLRNRQILLKRGAARISVLGLEDPGFIAETEDAEVRRKRVDFQLKDMIADSAGTYTILLSHRPELFPVYGENRIDLSLCGHAHGGQIRLPGLGGIIAPNQGLFPKYTSGLYQRDRAAMVVSRGLGNSLFPFRLNNPPEVVEIKLERRVPASGHADDK